MNIDTYVLAERKYTFGIYIVIQYIFYLFIFLLAYVGKLMYITQNNLWHIKNSCSRKWPRASKCQ